MIKLQSNIITRKHEKSTPSSKPTPTIAQFGVAGNRRAAKGAATFEELNKLAAERMAVDGKRKRGGDLDSLLGDLNLGDLDLGALMKDLDPDALQELVKEGLKDPQIQEMVSEESVGDHIESIMFV